MCCLLGQGSIAGRVTRRNLPWSAQLHKPPLNPPNIVFPIVWPTLYLLMGIASYRIYSLHSPHTVTHKSTNSAVQSALTVYFVQLFFNFVWSFLYFHFHSLLGAMLDCYLLTALIVVTMRQFYALDAVAFWLLVPYLTWSCFATYLSTGIYFLNPSASKKSGGVTHSSS